MQQYKCELKHYMFHEYTPFLTNLFITIVNDKKHGLLHSPMLFVSYIKLQLI